MNTYIKINNTWKITEEKWNRNLKWHEWIDLRLIQLRNWFYLLGKEK